MVRFSPEKGAYTAMLPDALIERPDEVLWR